MQLRKISVSFYNSFLLGKLICVCDKLYSIMRDFMTDFGTCFQKSIIQPNFKMKIIFGFKFVRNLKKKKKRKKL